MTNCPKCGKNNFMQAYMRGLLFTNKYGVHITGFLPVGSSQCGKWECATCKTKLQLRAGNRWICALIYIAFILIFLHFIAPNIMPTFNVQSPEFGWFIVFILVSSSVWSFFYLYFFARIEIVQEDKSR